MLLRQRLSIAASVVLATAAIAAPTREVKLRPVDVKAPLPEDMLHPEGKTRWHLESVTAGAAKTSSITEDADHDRSRWLLPDRELSQMRMGARTTVKLADMQADIETIGIGWAHLPSGPREVLLQKAEVHPNTGPDLLVYRGVDPRAGVVAQISRTSLEITEASVVDEVLFGAADLKIYSDELEPGIYTDLKYGWDKGVGTTVASLVPNPGIANICDLVNLNSWNFSGTTTGADVAYYQTPVNAAETCNVARCPAGTGALGREDRNITGTLRKDNQVTERETRANDITIWLRGGSQNENVGGAFGTGESGFCFATNGAIVRKPVPLWRFSHLDPDGYFLQAGDSWEMQPLDQPGDCQETFYTTKCGVTQFLTPNPLWARACTSSGQTHLGKQSIQIVKGGVVTLPSGHTLNALVVRNTTDFCVYSSAACSSPLDRVRTLVYYWQVPSLGSVVLLRSPKTVNYTTAEMTAGATTPCTNITTLDYTNVAFGLFPPLSITAGTASDTTVQLSWSPGNDVHRISGYKVYWDTDSGASSSYAFNSATHPGQASIVGTTATISGLTPGTTYYFTVTSLSSYTDPSSSVTTTYESLLYPTQVSGDPAFVYPIEVQGTTTGGTCIPAVEVTNLTVQHAPAGAITICWNAVSDPCLQGYEILGAPSPTSANNFSVVADTGPETCWTGSTSSGYFLVAARGTGGTGP